MNDKRGLWILASLGGLAVIGVADHLYLSAELSTFVLYGFPVGLAAWGHGRAAGLVLAGLAVGVWAGVHPELAEPFGVAILSWNVGARLAFFVIVALWLSGVRARHDSLVRSAYQDPLTGAANLRYFHELLHDELERSRRSGRPFTVAFMDLDDFKKVNDERGHAAGDIVLRLAAGAIRRKSRFVDRLGRLGGDEFGLIMPGTSAVGARTCVGKIHREFRRVMEAAGWKVGLSVGLFTCDDPHLPAESLMRRADEAMYRAKRERKKASSAEMKAVSIEECLT